MSSVASRAVRNSTGVRSPVWRSRLHTSNPSRSGSITSSTMRSGSHRGHGVDGVAAVGDRVHVEAGVAQGGLEHRAEVVLVVDEQEAGRWPWTRAWHRFLCGCCERAVGRPASELTGAACEARAPCPPAPATSSSPSSSPCCSSPWSARSSTSTSSRTTRRSGSTLDDVTDHDHRRRRRPRRTTATPAEGIEGTWAWPTAASSGTGSRRCSSARTPRRRPLGGRHRRGRRSRAPPSPTGDASRWT